MEPGTNSNGQTSQTTKTASNAYREANRWVGFAMQMAVDAFNWIFGSSYKLPTKSGNRKGRKSKGRHIF